MKITKRPPSKGNIPLQTPDMINPNVQRGVNILKSEKFCLCAAFCAPFNGAGKMEPPIIWAVEQMNQLLRKAGFREIQIIERRSEDEELVHLELQHTCWVDKSVPKT